MLAKPDPSTFQILPWRGEGPSTARMFRAIVMPDGSPSSAVPRFVITRTLGAAAHKGFTFYTTPEIESYLLHATTEAASHPVPVAPRGHLAHPPKSHRPPLP